MKNENHFSSNQIRNDCLNVCIQIKMRMKLTDKNHLLVMIINFLMFNLTSAIHFAINTT